ncbi:HAD-IIB family hydrolase [Catenovulum sediminis]|uniref:HAD-IIB family hydrolase n=1 Tax=Catenovulum sediminis TaxID=1740262 RepID=UPI00117C1D70|nr:HAD-IIB family hydrolase [Catenovulum sediminis]
MNSNTNMRLLVFTDMDGTLLDHDTYDWQAALPSINTLKKMDVPIICNTSKTLAEVCQLHEQINLGDPFIVENGSAIYQPAENGKTQLMHLIGARRADILDLLTKQKSWDYQFEGFNDWTVEQVIQHTGLSASEALLSKKRDFSEPIIWQGSEQEKQQFITNLQKQNLMALQGGRFLSIQGQCNKGIALAWLKSHYSQKWGCPVLTVALGDSENDCAMLEEADVSVWIKRHKPAPKLARKKQVYHSNAYGPAGWNESMEHILQSFSAGQLELL